MAHSNQYMEMALRNTIDALSAIADLVHELNPGAYMQNISDALATAETHLNEAKKGFDNLYR